MSLAIAIHGGAGVVARGRMSPAQESDYRTGLAVALDAGYGVLEHGGSSLDAVSTAVRLLEDDPQFNAGRGAVLNHAGAAELDAAIMDGSGPRAGAVAGIAHVRNPIDLARLVMEKSAHVMLIGAGAEEFALEHHLPLVPNSYFRTPVRAAELDAALLKERAASPLPAGSGTVGAVAMDHAGHLAAATSTGGMTNKRHGRVGDTPIIGAGTYANNACCAVSGTGSGEYFIRAVVAYDIFALMHYKGLALEDAAREVVQIKLRRAGGEGGVIAVDRNGRIAMEFNGDGMFRGARDSLGRREIAVY